MAENYYRADDGTLTPAEPVKAGWGLRLLMWWDRRFRAHRALRDPEPTEEPS